MPSLNELTDPAAVRRAIALFNELGRDVFLRRYGFGPARHFWLVVDGRRYDSKAIAGVAWGIQHSNGDDWLRPAQFVGGDATVRRKLESLGFAVVTDLQQTPPGRADRASPAENAPNNLGYRQKTWIFQANPDSFDISAYLATRPADLLWLVRQRAGDMAPGDRVFFWRAIGSGDRALSGVIGEAEVIEPPREQPEDDRAVSFWIGRSRTDNPALPSRRVRLRLLRLAEGLDILQRDTVALNPALAKMQVLTGRTGTNVLLRDDEADALHTLWCGSNTIPIAANPATDEIAADIAAVRSDPGITETTRLALVEARRGQGGFRAGLLRRWSGACAVTSVAVTEVLRASHIRPWRDATNDERLDPSNGLLLAAHLDALFDAGLISFEDDGMMLVSHILSTADRGRLGLPCSLRDRLTAAEKAFMAHHRDAWYQC